MLITAFLYALKRIEVQFRNTGKVLKYQFSGGYWPFTHTTPISGSALIMPPEIVRLFGIEITDQTLPDAAAWISQCAASNIRTNVAFLNTHCINVSFRESAYRRNLTNFDRIYGYGTGIRIAARSIGVRLRDNVNGTDIFPLICQEAERCNLGLFLFGYSEEITWRAARTMSLSYEQLSVCGTHHGYFVGPSEEQKIIDTINNSGAKILLVGLGVPFQENWIANNRHRITVPVIVGVGGLIDYNSVRRSRATRVFWQIGPEWIWRMLFGLRRLFGHHIVGNVEYLGRLAWHLVRRGGEFSGK